MPIIEHDHPAVAFLPRRLGEADAVGLHVPVVGPEVGGVQEKGDAAAGLVAGVRRLLRGGGPGQQQGRAAAFRGATTTQRLPSPSGASSSTENRSASVKKAMASS